MAEPATTEDTLLGGRVRLRQPRRGLRAGLDAVLLAAGVPARPGQTVLEAGCGSGAGFLCLAARVPGLRIIAIEQDATLAALARENAAANGVAAEVIEGDVRDLALARSLPRCDHGFANPPYWPGGTTPPEAIRRAATHEAARLTDWARFLAAPLAHRGSLSLILPAARLESGMAALAGSGCGSTRLLPFWPRAGVAAKRILLQARRGGRGPARVEPGMVLHEADGDSAAAAAVLRDVAEVWGWSRMRSVSPG